MFRKEQIIMDSISLDIAIKVIESLRAGIPTRISTHYLPEVRSHVTDKFTQDLQQLSTGQSIPSGRMIWGGYGQGKTHELTCIEHLALNSGFAVSRITLNRQLSGQKLFNLYQKLASSIRTANSQCFGIQRDLEQKRASDLSISQIQDYRRYTHPLPAIVLENYFHSAGEEQEKLYGSILGAKLPVPDIKRIHKRNFGGTFPSSETFAVTKHGKAYFEVMADVITWCGYKGWVLLIDEVELVSRLGKAGRLQAYQNLSWLVNWSQQLQFPIYTVGGIASPLMDIWNNAEKKKVPDKDLMADEADAKFGEAVGQQLRLFFRKALNSEICPHVRLLEDDQLVRLLENVINLHGISYNWQPNVDAQDIINSIGDSPVRTYIRATLEALDISRQYDEIIHIEPGDLADVVLTEGTTSDDEEG